MSKKHIKMLVLSMTGQCNYACRYCYAAYHDKSVLTPELIQKAIELVVKNNTDAASQEIKPFILQFSGGEPLLNWKGIKAAVEYVEAHKVPAQMQIQTNGSLITDEIARYLFKHKVGIGVSLDGRPRVNDRHRLCKDGSSASLATLQGIEILKRNNIACGLTCVVTDENVAELEGIVEFAYFLGNIRKIGFDLLRNQGFGNKLAIPNPATMKEAIARVYQKGNMLAKSFGYSISFAQQEKCQQLQRQGVSQGFSHCSAMTGEALFVDAKGRLYACASFVDDEDFYLGTVDSGVKPELSALISKRINEAMRFCTACQHMESCGGGCLARWYNKDGFVKYESECIIKTMSKV